MSYQGMRRKQLDGYLDKNMFWRPYILERRCQIDVTKNDNQINWRFIYVGFFGKGPQANLVDAGTSSVNMERRSL